MSSADGAVLSSASSMLDDLIERVSGVADRYVGTNKENIAHQLHEVERSLRSAARTLEAAQRDFR